MESHGCFTEGNYEGKYKHHIPNPIFFYPH